MSVAWEASFQIMQYLSSLTGILNLYKWMLWNLLPALVYWEKFQKVLQFLFLCVPFNKISLKIYGITWWRLGIAYITGPILLAFSMSCIDVSCITLLSSEILAKIARQLKKRTTYYLVIIILKFIFSSLAGT